MFFLNLKSIGLGFIWIFFGFILYMLRIVGKHRLKIAIIGANLLCCVFILLLIFLFEGIFPEIFPSIKFLIIFTLVMFIVFSLRLLIEVITPSRKEEESIKNLNATENNTK